MSIFGSIVDKIFHHASGTAQAAGAQAGASGTTGQQSQRAAPTGQQGQAPASGSQSGGGAQSSGAGQAQAAAQPGMTTAGQQGGGGQGQSAGAQRQLSNVDVDAVLTKVAAGKGGGGNWRTSIVDLLKLLDLDSSLTARKELANELGVHEGADGSAEQNMALQKAVMRKLAENGGNVPESLRH